MAKSLNTIRMDFRNANNCANQLEEAGQQLRNMANNKFQSEINMISQSWNGKCANVYINKCDMLRNQMFDTSRQLINTANTIRMIAKTTYTAELNSIQIATKNRK